MQLKLKNKLFVCTLIVLFTAGCAGREHPQVNEQASAKPATANSIDPYEGLNRSIYKFNTKLDKYILKPLAKTYETITPDPVESGIHKFFENLEEPRNAVNSLLQGKFDKAGLSTGRFVLNSTVGVLGFFDVADKLDIPRHDEDFGQTLAAWGLPSGPYIVLPLFGPRYLRHAAGFIPDSFTNPVNYVSDDTVRYGLLGLDIIDARTRFLGTDDLIELQLDPYVFIRETYLQRRGAALNDRPVTAIKEGADEFDDGFDDELEEDEI